MFMSRASEVGQWRIGGWVGKVGGCTRRRPEKFKYIGKKFHCQVKCAKIFKIVSFAAAARQVGRPRRCLVLLRDRGWIGEEEAKE